MRRFALSILGCGALLLQVAWVPAASASHRQSAQKRSAATRQARHHRRRNAAKHIRKHPRHPLPPPLGEGGQSGTGPITGPIAETPPVVPTPPAPPAEEAKPVEETPPVKETPMGEARVSSSNPFAALPLYVEPGSPASKTAAEWAGQGRAAEAHKIEKIALQPVAKWFGDWTYGHGGTSGDVSWWVGQAAGAGALPVLVAYDAPWRDCNLFSSGGAANAAAYRKFIDEMAAGIATRKAVVIVEPDALAELGCLSAESQATYYSLLSYAVKTLGKHSGTSVYLDAGHSGWQSPATMASRLKQADVAGARGFSLNVSSFDTSASEAAYGRAISAALPTAGHFVIDTSRNGRGPAGPGEWCNPPGRGLGTPPTAGTSEAAIDAYVWVKHPGTSDGTCNGGPPAGTWWPAKALELATNAAG
jgi:endoglucanase